MGVAKKIVIMPLFLRISQYVLAIFYFVNNYERLDLIALVFPLYIEDLISVN